jgi:hypothetical protein
LLLDPDPDPYLLLEDLDLDPGGPKTHGSDGSGFGSATLEEAFMVFDRHNLGMGCQLIYTGVFPIILVVFYDN